MCVCVCVRACVCVCVCVCVYRVTGFCQKCLCNRSALPFMDIILPLAQFQCHQRKPRHELAQRRMLRSDLHRTDTCRRVLFSVLSETVVGLAVAGFCSKAHDDILCRPNLSDGLTISQSPRSQGKGHITLSTASFIQQFIINSFRRTLAH